MTDLISRQAAIKTAHFPVIDDASYEVVRVDDILALPSAQPVWIPTSERTPEKSGNYLVTTPDGQVELRYYSTLYRWYGWVDMVAWMPLPTPWEGEKP